MFNQGNAGSQREIQLTIEENEVFIQKGEAVDRLLDNPDFQAVIMEGFVKGEAHRLALATDNPALESPEAQARIFNQIKAIGVFVGYLRKLDNDRNTAVKTKAEHEQELIEREREEQAGGLEG
ncbi:MAG: hypothetical protein J6N20_09290 [Pseudomonas sp.]|nr:hypothetical protein [Pseudomonas sp.]